MVYTDFIYLLLRDTERDGQRHRQKEKQAPCREPDVDPVTPGSHPGPKAGAKPLSHPGIPHQIDFYTCKVFVGHALFPAR